MITLNPDYPRMMFHRTLEPVTVYSEDEEAALGPEWSRIIQPPAPPEEPPKRRSRPPKESADVVSQ
ncbi:MAG TPA: hypothetical protein VKB88_21615 [Bryobacteraceae bacterium]|nr:hypothetical protein [Bryobacteraceae bacterium]